MTTLMYLKMNLDNYLVKLTLLLILLLPLWFSPVRRIPVSLTEKVKNELDHLSAKNVITSVQQPTDWVSNLVVTMKKIW